VQCTLEQVPDSAASLADRESLSPRADAGSIGEPGEPTCGVRQFVGRRVRVGSADQRARRLVVGEGVLNAVDLLGDDISAVSGVRDR
jgi:hypothetical protein